MKKYEKEVQQAFLDNEKEVLEALKKNYEEALLEINSNLQYLMNRSDSDMQHVIFQAEYQKALKDQIEGILNQLNNNEFETVSEYLAHCYEEGFVGTMYSLQSQGIPLVFPIDQKKVVQAIQHDTKLSTNLYSAFDMKDLKKKIAGEISRGISSGSTYNEVARNISGHANVNLNNAMRISRTEGHRINIKSAMDACQKAREKGADVLKSWDASLDGKTRPHHRELDGQIRELDEDFEYSGGTVSAPAHFGIASEDINCRCALLQRARWALGVDITKYSPDAVEEISDDGATKLFKIKAKDYDDFKKKYMSEAEKLAYEKRASDRVRSNVQKINPTNKFGKEVVFNFDGAKNPERAEQGKQLLNKLLNEYDSYLTEVKTGAKNSAGDVGMDGTMRLSNYKPETIIHEFGHALASSDRVKYNLADEKEAAFMKELTKIRTQYEAEVNGNPRKGIKGDRSVSISAYSHHDKDEFLAEAFAHAKMKELGEEIPFKYGDNFKYSDKVLDLVNKYFGKDPLENGGESSKIDITRYIGKSIEKTDNQSVREWYHSNVHDIPNQVDKTKPFEEQVKQAFELRNKYKHEARIAMSDRETAERLEAKKPAPSFDKLLKDKMDRKGLSKEEALEDILKTASKTNTNVDKEFGL